MKRKTVRRIALVLGTVMVWLGGAIAIHLIFNTNSAIIGGMYGAIIGYPIFCAFSEWW